ncbi:MAG: PilW family protein [Marinobacter sp.]|uniref:PilW family protein n=1 Tax=Marinobacter sp. TaxID=50741 RepID=UPI001B6066AC|nr:PilW family protein [Marinobacter sp.]MBQ0745831.1 PilW family protein [Marinobacter sp.]MBQ0814235.1 PilW family protein [Marinobacter sp.]|tara:strand:+ start:1887 stop:2966 length:1080 start_codon:yes stop_codon:yes gene_type:complete
MKRFYRLPVSPGTQTGLSLIELMIALLLGTLLTVGLVQVFTSNSQSFRYNESSARALESGRIAADILSRAIRNAGFFGCYPINGITNNLDNSDSEYDAVRHGFATLGVSAVGSERPGAAIAGTDFFNITGVRRPGAIVKLDADMTATNSILLNDAGGLSVNELAFITNCEQGDIFQISSLTNPGGNIQITADDTAGVNGSGSPGNDLSGNVPLGCTTAGSCLSAVYQRGTELFQPFSEAYYIGNATDGGTSLFMRQASGVNIELVAGVEDMNVRFGEGTVTTGVQNWRAASAVTSWDNVLAVEVSLLVASPNDNIMDSAQAYCFPGWEDCVADASKLTTAADRRMYRVYTFTNALRNPF